MTKRARALDPDEEDYYYEDEVDERNNPSQEAAVVPPGFLSPSVREYLDLGKSIPGRLDFSTQFFCFIYNAGYAILKGVFLERERVLKSARLSFNTHPPYT